MVVILLTLLAIPSHGRRVNLRDESSVGQLEEANLTRSKILPQSVPRILAELLFTTPQGRIPLQRRLSRAHATQRFREDAFRSHAAFMQLRELAQSEFSRRPLFDGRGNSHNGNDGRGNENDGGGNDGNDNDDLDAKQNAVKQSQKKLGPTHPETLKALLDYGVALIELGREVQANSLLEEAFSDLVLDLNHPDSLASFTPDTLTAFNQYADRLSQLGRRAEAEELKKEILEVIEVKKEWGCSQEAEKGGLEDEDLEGCLAEDIFEVAELKEVVEADVKRMEVPTPPAEIATETPKTSGKVMEDYSAYEASDVKIAVAMFDFDQTLSTEHVFLTLSQYVTSMKRRDSDLDQLYDPVAVSPAGQLSRLTLEHEKYNAQWAFGGAERIEAIRDMLERLQARGVKMMICTLGFPAVQRKLLEEVDLLKYFGWEGVPAVVGVSGASYQQYFTRYDMDAAEQHEVVEQPDEILKVNKVKLLDTLLRKESTALNMKLPLHAGVLVEDDTRMISLAKVHVRQDSYKRVISSSNLHSVRVSDRQGMQPDVEMKQLLEIAEA